MQPLAATPNPTARWEHDAISRPPLLDVRRVSMRFGGLRALREVAFAAFPGDITAVIGPNGAGKTTLFNCITGFYTPSAGELLLAAGSGVPLQLHRMSGHRIARAGIARTFQNIRLFPGMTVLENLVVAQHIPLMRASGYTALGVLGWPGYARAERAAIEFAKDWLDRIGLYERADEPAAELSYGAQRRLEIARAMCTRPTLLCLDEPAAGLNPRESAELSRLLLEIRSAHATSILLIEHDMSVVMGISDHGVVIANGAPKAVRDDPRVIKAYLGEPDDADLPAGEVPAASETQAGRRPSAEEGMKRSPDRDPALEDGGSLSLAGCD